MRRQTSGNRSAVSTAHGSGKAGGGDEEAASSVRVVLLEAGADPNARDTGGNTPLHLTHAFSGFSDDLDRALIRAGADPNLLDEDGKPYHCYTFACLAKKTYRRER